MYKNIVNNLKITRELIVSFVEEGDVVVDCTAGNGYDTLQLANAVGGKGKVYAFDIQDEAIDNTRKRLEFENLLDRVILIKDGHENIEKYIRENVRFIVYNLGYLPGDNKDIITRASTTVESINKALILLKPNGLLVITSYIGHDGGMEENLAVIELLRSLDQKKYNVLELDFINQKNQPPKLYIVEKNSKWKEEIG